MEYHASKSDIDFDFEDSDGDDVSISTDASSVEQQQNPLPNPRNNSVSGIQRMTAKFEHSVELDNNDCVEYEEDLELLRGIGGNDDDSVSDSDASIGSEDEDHEMPLRYSVSSLDSDDFGAPIVVPLKTGSDYSNSNNNHSNSEPIEPGSRSSRDSRRTARAGSFSRKAPPRTKSGEGITSSSQSNTSGNFRRRPPMRTKSGEAGIAASDNTTNNSTATTNCDDGNNGGRRRPIRRTKSGEGEGGIRRRPPQRTKSGGTLRSTRSEDSNKDDGSSNSNKGEEEDYEGREYEGVLPAYDDGGGDDDSFDGSEGTNYRERALHRNAARRQKSSDMLGAMREATRNIPSRSQSSVDGNLSNGRRRGAGRSKSSGVKNVTACFDGMVASPGRKPMRRQAPERTKSGSTMAAPQLPLET